MPDINHNNKLFTFGAAGVALKNQFVGLGSISMVGETLSAMLLCRIYRDVTGSDSHTGDVALMGVDFHYEIDAPGSEAELSK